MDGCEPPAAYLNTRHAARTVCYDAFLPRATHITPPAHLIHSKGVTLFIYSCFRRLKRIVCRVDGVRRTYPCFSYVVDKREEAMHFA